MWGRVESEGAGRTLTFEREMARPVEKVWAALITPARLADWLCADAEVEPWVGGSSFLKKENYV